MRRLFFVGRRSYGVVPTGHAADLPGILVSYWPENNRANRAQSVALQDEDKEGSAAAIDDEAFVVQRLYDAATHAGPPAFQAFSQPFEGGAVWRQFGYPLVALDLASLRAPQAGC